MAAFVPPAPRPAAAKKKAAPEKKTIGVMAPSEPDPVPAVVASASIKQHLAQEICGRFGWGLRYFHDGTTWCVEVGIGKHGKNIFKASTPMPDGSTEGRHLSKAAKAGTKAAAEVAVTGLAQDVARELERPTVTFESIFEGSFRGEILEATPDSWKKLRAHLDSDEIPRCVGIDAEGIHSTPPKMVQIATRKMILIELPGSRGRLSDELEELLWDDSISKIFCDSTNSDKACLGLPNVADQGAGDYQTSETYSFLTLIIKSLICNCRC